MVASTRGIALGSPHSLVWLHTSVWPKPPSHRQGSPDSSKQSLEGFCATAGTFLPPTKGSNRGSTSVGHETKIFQPLRTKEERRSTTHSGPASSEPLPLQREFQDVDVEDVIMFQIQVGDWFVTVDLKDAYFSIQVVQQHRKFLRFAFGGNAYENKVVPFGLAVAPRMFTKCMDAALAPLRLQGIRVLNYLNDWLILAHSRELVSYHRDIILHHIRALGLRTNTKNSVLTPSRQTVFLGVHSDSVQILSDPTFLRSGVRIDAIHVATWLRRTHQ